MRARIAMLLLAVVSLFLVIVVGAYVTAAGFGAACDSPGQVALPSDWPGCLGGLFPPLQLAPVMEYLHRILAALSTLFLFIATGLFVRQADPDATSRRVLIAASGLLVLQILLGGLVIAQGEEAVTVAAHQGIAILTFGMATAAYAYASRRQ